MPRLNSRREVLALAAAWSVTLASTSAPAGSATYARRLDLRYQMSWGGVQIGTAAFRATPGERLTLALDAEVQGLLGLTEGSETSLRTELAGETEGQVRPIAFEGSRRKPDRTRATEIRYARDGSISASAYTQNGEPRASDVVAADQDGTVDMLTALWRARIWLVEAVERKNTPPFRADVFDGRRRYEIAATLLGTGINAEAGVDGETHHLELDIEVEGNDDGDGLPFRGRAVDVYVGADDRLVPVHISARGRLPWAATLVG